MINNLICIILLFTLLSVKGIMGEVYSQQTPQYTQFMMNNYGLNPAACGTSSNRVEALTGIRRQWIGFENPPVTTFFNVNCYFKGPYSKSWHAIGGYWQGDRMGEIIKTDDFYVSYTYLMKTMKKGFLSFGLAVGARRYATRFLPTNDPVLISNNIWLFPDFIPGIKFWNKKWVFDLSIKQLYKSSVEQGGEMAGSPTRLDPHMYFTAMYKWRTPSNLLIVQAIHVKYTIAILPSFDYTILAHVHKNFALGLSYKHLDAIAGIVQFRFHKLIVGFAYDYTIAPYRIGFANTQEFMVGVSPTPWDNGEDSPSQYSTGECAEFE